MTVTGPGNTQEPLASMQPPRLEAGALRKMASFRRNGTPVQANATHDSKAGKE